MRFVTIADTHMAESERPPGPPHFDGPGGY